jgi:hypothetical protein
VTDDDERFARLLWRGWTGTRLENWITSQFWAIVTREYPDGEFPQ